MKGRERVAEAVEAARPLVDRIAHDEDLHDHVKNAYESARRVYDELLGDRGTAGIAMRVARERIDLLFDNRVRSRRKFRTCYLPKYLVPPLDDPHVMHDKAPGENVLVTIYFVPLILKDQLNGWEPNALRSFHDIVFDVQQVERVRNASEVHNSTGRVNRKRLGKIHEFVVSR